MKQKFITFGLILILLITSLGYSKKEVIKDRKLHKFEFINVSVEMEKGIDENGRSFKRFKDKKMNMEKFYTLREKDRKKRYEMWGNAQYNLIDYLKNNSNDNDVKVIIYLKSYLIDPFQKPDNFSNPLRKIPFSKNIPKYSYGSLVKKYNLKSNEINDDNLITHIAVVPLSTLFELLHDDNISGIELWEAFKNQKDNILVLIIFTVIYMMTRGVHIKILTELA